MINGLQLTFFVASFQIVQRMLPALMVKVCLSSKCFGVCGNIHSVVDSDGFDLSARVHLTHRQTLCTFNVPENALLCEQLAGPTTNGV